MLKNAVKKDALNVTLMYLTPFKVIFLLWLDYSSVTISSTLFWK